MRTIDAYTTYLTRNINACKTEAQLENARNLVLAACSCIDDQELLSDGAILIYSDSLNSIIDFKITQLPKDECTPPTE